MLLSNANVVKGFSLYYILLYSVSYNEYAKKKRIKAFSYISKGS